MLIRANANTPEQAIAARDAGFPGIGLCQTESMLLGPKLSKWMHASLSAVNEGERQNALSKLLPVHQADLEKIFSAMSPHPVFVRLLDPPIQYLLPTLEQINSTVAAALSDEDWDAWTESTRLRQQLASVSAQNPQLGNRGCRLCVTQPQIMAMQVTAILQAAIAAEQKGTPALPAIIIPLVATEEETSVLTNRVRSIAAEVFRTNGRSVNYKVGVLIELPRAAICAGAIARHVDCVCFGTNDLTQMTFGFSREESSAYLQAYLDEGIFKQNPFVKFDQGGVGQLLAWAVRDIRSLRPEMEIGVCGDHCDDQDALRFFQSLGADFMSCPVPGIEKSKQTPERDEARVSTLA
jgi:pyruvate, orthophosphate dikinase